ncbi:acyl-CoA N-acyltransferase, partial [Trichoderma evansii]
MTVSKPLFAPTLESDRLTYDIFDMKNDTHMQFTVDLFNHFMPGAGPTDGAWTNDDIRSLIFSLMMKPSESHGRPDTPCWYIPYLKTAPAIPIGLISLCRRTPDIPLDLGYVIIPEHQRKGYGLEGSARISRYWKDEFGLKEICIITTEDNIPSKKLAEGNGYVDGGYVTRGDAKMIAYVLPGMKKLEGQNFPMRGDGKTPEAM